jgi:hypothetical protein
MGTERSDKAAVDAIFGTELPQESSDEREPMVPAEMDERDRWLRENVPPHHI